MPMSPNPPEARPLLDDLQCLGHNRLATWVAELTRDVFDSQPERLRFDTKTGFLIDAACGRTQRHLREAPGNPTSGRKQHHTRGM